MFGTGKVIRNVARNYELLSMYAGWYRDSMHSTIVLTFGAFDIIHSGHLLYLERAKSFGHVLMVGITSDAEIRMVKGLSRPVNRENDRAFIVAGFGCVDHVFVFDSDDCAMIELIQPDVCVYSETSEKKMEQRGREKVLVERYGGRIVCLPAQSQRHTSDIIRELQRA